MARLIFFLWVLLACAAPGVQAADADPARAPLDEVLPGAALVADVEQLQRTYTALHPGLYRYASRAQVQARFDALRRELSGGATRREAFLAFSRFAASVRCGHTHANVLNQPQSLQDALLAGAGRVPFHFRWIDGRMVVTDGFGIPGLQRGAQVLSIGGVATADILAGLMRVARADGGNDAKRIAQMQVLGYENIEPFDVYLPLLHPSIGERPVVAWRNPDGAQVQRALQGLTLAQRRAQSADASSAADEAPAWTLDTADPSLAILRMPTWALYRTKWDWRGFLRRTFGQLDAEGTPALVIDLRGNEGGMGVGEVLLPHLTDVPFDLPRIEHRVRARRVPDALRAGLSTWDPSFYDWSDAARPRAEGGFLLTRWLPEGGVGRITPTSPRYRGRVFVLIGPENSSATFEFAQWVKTARLGTLVGQVTGGNQRGINGSAYLFLTLANSGIELDLPLVGQFPVGTWKNGAPPDAGIEPDIRVAPTVQSVIAGTDVELAAVRGALVAPGCTPSNPRDGGQGRHGEALSGKVLRAP